MIDKYLCLYNLRLSGMLRKNLFYGESAKAHFVRIAYRQLMSRRWVAYADVLAEYMGLTSAAELKYSISKYYEYGQVIKIR